jgi:hypothetical protein
MALQMRFGSAATGVQIPVTGPDCDAQIMVWQDMAGLTTGISADWKHTMSGAHLYDTIGTTYSATRRTEPRIAARIWTALGDASTVLNVGAGTGSYDPPGRDVTAVEPSAARFRWSEGRVSGEDIRPRHDHRRSSGRTVTHPLCV